MASSNYQIVFNGETRDCDSGLMTGRQLRALFNASDDGELIVEGEGDAADRRVGDYEVVALHEGVTRIFVRPPTNFGAHRL